MVGSLEMAEAIKFQCDYRISFISNSSNSSEALIKYKNNRGVREVLIKSTA